MDQNRSPGRARDSDAGALAEFALGISEVELFVAKNHDVIQTAMNTDQTTTEMTIHTSGMRVRAPSTDNIACVTNSSSCCERIKTRNRMHVT